MGNKNLSINDKILIYIFRLSFLFLIVFYAFQLYKVLSININKDELIKEGVFFQKIFLLLLIILQSIFIQHLLVTIIKKLNPNAKYKLKLNLSYPDFIIFFVCNFEVLLLLTIYSIKVFINEYLLIINAYAIIYFLISLRYIIKARRIFYFKINN